MIPMTATLSKTFDYEALNSSGKRTKGKVAKNIKLGEN